MSKPIPKYLVDGIVSVATHNDVSRVLFYELNGAEKPTAEPCLQIAIPVKCIDQMLKALKRLKNPEFI